MNGKFLQIYNKKRNIYVFKKVKGMSRQFIQVIFKKCMYEKMLKIVNNKEMKIANEWDSQK